MRLVIVAVIRFAFLPTYIRRIRLDETGEVAQPILGYRRPDPLLHVPRGHLREFQIPGQLATGKRLFRVHHQTDRCTHLRIGTLVFCRNVPDNTLNDDRQSRQFHRPIRFPSRLRATVVPPQSGQYGPSLNRMPSR